MVEDTRQTMFDAAAAAEEHVFRHMDKTDRIELRTILSTAALLNLDQP